MYADDLCVHRHFDCVEDFENTLRAIGQVFDLLEHLKLDINFDKTTATLRMRGKLLNKLQRRFLLRTKEGTFLLIPRSDGRTSKIKLVRSYRYLGVSLSYYGFELETMKMRIQHSEQTSHQLHRWLYSSHSMSLQRKVHLWYQCVHSCLRYGLVYTGITTKSVRSYFQFCMKQLRRIFRKPTFIDRRTHFASGRTAAG